MEPATATAMVTAVIGAVGTVLGAWVGGRAQRKPGREQSRLDQAGGLPADSLIDPGTHVLVIEAVTATDRELLPDDHQ